MHRHLAKARWACLPSLLVLAACASAPVAPDRASSPAPSAAARPAPTNGPAAASTATQTPQASLGTPFSTRHARFEPTPFDALPGWGDDAVRESLDAFLQTCNALRKRAAWQDLCTGLQQLDRRDDHALRQYFQDNFHAYAVMDPDQDDEGVITGYYEPILNGSRQRSARYAHPVYSVPADLLFLDARRVHDGQQIWLSLDKRELVPAAAHAAGAQRYVIRLDGLTPGIRDKRYRVRIQQQDGHAVVRPYWNRQAIERRRLDAQVLAWVEDPYALYAMQIQGSGKIRLDGGDDIVRVAYGEQNGHPFLPQVSRRNADTVSTAVKTRGLQLSAPAGAASAPVATAMAMPQTPATVSPPAAAAAQPYAPTANDAANDEEVRRLVAALGGQGSQSSAARPATARPARPPQSARPQTGDAQVAAIIAALQGKAPMTAPPATQAAPTTSAAAPSGAIPADDSAAHDPAGLSTGIPDPSYVFFRRIPDGPHGPLGALGVPLTAGRSIAVDPRTTPLGMPVYLSTVHGGSSTTLNRLVFAQDTGGAIRGSVRADFFWGSGVQAGRQAASMKAPGRMWLLMPRAQEISALSTMRTRSAPGAASGPLADCVIADEDLCVEDWSQ